MLRSVSIAIVALALVPASAPAKEWALKMFQGTSHDFGHVARGAKAEFAFELLEAGYSLFALPRLARACL